MTDPTTHTPTWVPALTGSCACCGTSTGSVFAMGHDARFRGALALVIAAPGTHVRVADGPDGLVPTLGWDQWLNWWTSPETCERVTVREALRRVGILLGRDWSTKVRESAARKGVDPGPLDTPVEVVERSSTNRAPRTEESEEARRARSEARIDALMESLNRRPFTGQWGFYRSTPDAPRQSARVQATHFAEESPLIDLYVVGRGIVSNVSPSTFTRDESARES